MAENNLLELAPNPFNATAVTYPAQVIALSYSNFSKYLNLVVSSLSTHPGSPAFCWTSWFPCLASWASD